MDKETNEPLPGVNVVLTHIIQPDGKETELDRPMGSVTDVDGYYFIMNVPSGNYILRASLIGYGTVTQKMVKVELDRTTTVNYELSTNSIQTEQIIVTAKKEVVKQDVAGTQEEISAMRIQQMPVLRVDEFVGQLKGIQVVSSSEGNGLQVRGGSIRETQVFIDGMSLQDPRSQTSYLNPNATAIASTQVITGGFEAKYGGITSGVVNFITKDGSRDRYTVSIRANMTPSGQRRYFGNNPWSDDNIIYQIFSGKYAMDGVGADSLLVPEKYKDFKGWNNENLNDLKYLTPEQRLDLWNKQHPKYSYQARPDIYVEGSITGPVPGESVPFWGEFAKRTTFLAAFKYENTQMAFPTSPRDNYIDWNGQLKLTTLLQDNLKLQLNGFYSKINSANNGTTTSIGADGSSSFGFVNNNEYSIIQQAGRLSGTNIDFIWDKSRQQYYEQRNFAGGAKMTHTLSSKAFYTLEFNTTYTDQNLLPFKYDPNNYDYYANYAVQINGRDTVLHFALPQYGTPNGSTNYGYDANGDFAVYGGMQRADSSYAYTYNFKGDMTYQLGIHNQLEAGFSFKYNNVQVYAGSWSQAYTAFTPGTWQYYKAKPLEGGLYLQDKMEFEGMVLTGGLRLDYFNPQKDGYQVSLPEYDAYKNLYDEIYSSLPGSEGSYERWVAWRDLLSNLPGVPKKSTSAQLHLSPRLGVSFPITEQSKLYFNFATTFQRQPMAYLYNTVVYQGSVAIPTPDLPMRRTIHYEFGYEQVLFGEVLANATAYYKDNANGPLGVSYLSYYNDNNVSVFTPDGFSDAKGLELRLERPVGRYFTFSAMYDYMMTGYGQSGISTIYEDKTQSRDGLLRTVNINSYDVTPRANINLNFHTPEQSDSKFMGVDWLGNWYANIFFEWKAYPKVNLNSGAADPKDYRWVDRVSRWNINMRLSKAFNTQYGSLEFMLTVQNLTNNKYLEVGNMADADYKAYINSLKTPDKGGNDKFGDYNSDDGHIVLPWWQMPLFLNPRKIVLGASLNF
ncbi:MAG: TonB-dependent receptor [Ignavibacteria bacterium]|nr:TonB-dependent receptor [Ignavibacteria bacterium]MCU7502058.1 TonB-dependent receptor [Ignavibacteria bacterium]MCU7515460.1 TonB-dependent receptor [Ignavibacteria bacterium]